MDILQSSTKSKVLIIDDEELTRETLTAFYLNEGYEVQSSESASEVIKNFQSAGTDASQFPDLVVCDLMMPEMDGVAFVEKVQELPVRPPVILVTGRASIKTAVDGLGKGAADYITKPVQFAELAVISSRVIRIRTLEEKYRLLKIKSTEGFQLSNILGKSHQIQTVFDCIRRLSRVTCNVLITGESGTGKDMVARAIHANSPRANKPYVAINCAAIPDTLLESELFGHAKGSFTGATERRRGLLEEAHEGTLFLDEIGDMPLPLQAKLLRFLQEKKIKAVGDNHYKTVDVRVIAATHVDLKDAVKEKKFRKDLYFRLCVVPIEIAPLRQRKEDIILLAEHFLSKFSEKNESRPMGFTRAALAKLTRLPWPGNVRELENSIERAVVFAEGKLVDEQHIQASEMAESESTVFELFSQMKSLREIEKEYIEYILLQTENKKDPAAEILGINRKTLYRKQKEYGIQASMGLARERSS